MTSIANHLLGQARSAVLSALFLHPEKSLHVRELARTTGASPGSLHRELRALADLGLLLRREVGRQVHYQANPHCVVFAELAGLLRNTAGLADVLREALQPLGRKVAMAFVYGSVAAGSERPGSDVDVMLLGSAGFGDVALAFARVQEAVGRQVNPTPMSASDFVHKLADGGGFVRNVVAGPKIWLIGGDDDFAKLVAHRQA